MLDRALPGWAIDLCRDGVDPDRLRQKGDRAVFSTLVSIAMSAQARGWGDVELEALILDDQRSNLGNQVRLRGGKHPRSRAQIAKLMRDAWNRAWEHRTSETQWSPDQAAEEVARRAAHAVNIAADADNDLHQVDRDVLHYIATQAKHRGSTRVTLPRRALQQAVGAGERTVRNSLGRLIAARHLDLVERGRPRGTTATSKARANVYALPAAPLLVPVNGLVGPPALSSGTPTPETAGTPALSSGTPDMEAEMIEITSQPDGTVTVRGSHISPEVILAALQRGMVTHQQATGAAPSTNVVPIRRKPA